jgi:hypothetical protein
MALSTMSVRVPPEHHQLIRDIATALRTRPELAGVLRDVLQVQYGGVTERDTEVLQSILESLAIEKEFSRRIMAFAENINDRVKALEQLASVHEETGAVNHPPSVYMEDNGGDNAHSALGSIGRVCCGGGLSSFEDETGGLSTSFK